jgi:hypothetical protein
MEAGNRITLGITVALIVVAAMSREFLWTTLPLTLFAIFLFVWAREERRTETFIGRLPIVGQYALKALEKFDSIISPRDQEHEHHVATVINGYDHDLRKSLRELWRTKNSSHTPANHLNIFIRDGLIDFPNNGPGWIKDNLRRVIGRTLDKLGP